MSVHVFGIRHHGPGSARSLLQALEALAPDCVLVEGPPDADEVLPLAAQEEMKPPVALLVYDVAAPGESAFYPFATFSPEWQAIRYALARKVPVQFIDLPIACQELAVKRAPAADGGADAAAAPAPAGAQPGAAGAEAGPGAAAEGTGPAGAGAEENGDGEAEVGADGEAEEGGPAEPDPVAALARAAGHDDGEEWWEEMVERRRDPAGLFEGLAEAMAALREGHTPSRREAQREAHMRRCIRAAERTFGKIAVVCGAWHVPALVDRPAAKLDDALLKGLPKRKVEATWIPWTFDRLALHSGYGAGVRSPGWYEHVWETGRSEEGEARWLSRAAGLLRGAGLEAPSSSVIEAVRLSRALAALRGRTSVGLHELNESALAVLCRGDARPLLLIHAEQQVGVVLGEVPEGAPAVPLARDLALQQKALRLKPTAEAKALELDLRQESDRAKSRLLHRLALFGVDWGELQHASGLGTFKEAWSLQWDPEYALKLVEASVFGNTVESAAAGKVRALSRSAQDLPELTQLLDAAVLAELPGAIGEVLAALEARAALAADVRHLMVSLLRLARLHRYGSVRQLDPQRLAPILDDLFPRIVVGVHPACASLDDEAAAKMLEGVTAVHEALSLLEREPARLEWRAALEQLSSREGVHCLLRGACVRALLEQGALDDAVLTRRARLALSPARPAADCAAWAEGLLRGSAQLLLHREGVWASLDAWLSSLSPDTFTTLLPLVRRAFSPFDASERRAMGERVLALGRGGVRGEAAASSGVVDEERAALVHPVLSRILGVALP
jgi:Family of unknown function (DUF5682)